MLTDKVKGKQRAIKVEHLTIRSTERVSVLVPRTASISEVLDEAKIDPPPSPFPSGNTLSNPQPNLDLHPISDRFSFGRPTQVSPLPPATTFPPLSKPSLPDTPPSPDIPRSRFSPAINRCCPRFEGIPSFLPSIPPPTVLHAESPTNRPSSPFPFPSNTFIFGPSKMFPSLTAVPLVPSRRVYQGYPSRNRFFCTGRLLTGGDSPWPFIVTLVFVVAISATWFSTTCVWWWKNESPAVVSIGAYMTLLTISCMLATAFRDPGILPRGLDPDPPLPGASPSDGGVRVPLPRDLRVRTATVRVKYCLHCGTYRPPRCSHCTLCDNCVDRCDHHCQWINNCIGRRNYTFFFCFLLFSVLTLCLVISTSAFHLYVLTQTDRVNIRQAGYQGVGSIITVALSIPVTCMSTPTLVYHIRLLLGNITMIEEIRNRSHKSLLPDVPPSNPFSYGPWKVNVAETLCQPAGFSWLNAHAIVTEDKRRVNPGLEDTKRSDDDLEQVGRIGE